MPNYAFPLCSMGSWPLLSEKGHIKVNQYGQLKVNTQILLLGTGAAKKCLEMKCSHLKVFYCQKEVWPLFMPD